MFKWAFENKTKHKLALPEKSFFFFFETFSLHNSRRQETVRNGKLKTNVLNGGYCFRDS